MASSPLTLAGAVPTFEIVIDDSPLDPVIEIEAIEITMTLAGSHASIRVADGRPGVAFSVSESDSFVPGKAIRISIGYDGALTQVFSGWLVRQRLEIGDAGPRLLADAKGDLPTGVAPARPVLTLTYGDSILAFEGGVDAPAGTPRGEVTFQGNALVMPRAVVTLAGLGARFDGNVSVTMVHHRIAEGQWRTTLGFGPAD